MKRVIIAVIALLAVTCILPTYAADTGDKPSKESLLAAWEQAQKENPYTVKLEKTAESGIYNFETTIFPYKGKLKIDNLLIDAKPAYYYDEYSSGEGGDYIGVVELELLNADKDLRGKYRYSYETWERDNALHYDLGSGKWYTPEKWVDHQAAIKPAKQSACGGSISDWQDLKSKFFNGQWIAYLFVGFIIWGIIQTFIRQRKLREQYKQYQDEYRKRAEESIALSRAGIELQKEILGVLKAKA